MFRKMTIALTLAICATAAFALPKPSEVKAAVASGNYAKAESMLLEVMKEKPSAKAHYDLGQVYAFEGKHKDSLNEFRQAQALDPTLKFASSAAEFTKKLANEQTLVAPPPVVVAQQQHPVSTVAQAEYGKIYSNPREIAQPLPVQHDSGGSGGTILAVLLVVLLAGGIAAYFLTRKKVTDDLNEKAGVSKERKNTLLDFAKKLEDAALITKTATYGDASKRQILDRIIGLQTQVRNALADLKDGKEVTASRLATIETNVDSVVDQSANGIRATVEETTSAWRDAPKPMFPEAAPAPFTPPAPMPPAPSYSSAPAPRVVHHHHYDPAPAPVVQNNSGDMLTGILIGQAISHPTHERTVYVEREAPRRVERDEYVAEPAPAPVYQAPAPTPKFDTSSDDTDDYVAAAPSVDAAPAADDTY